MVRHHACGLVVLDPDPELASAGVRALRELADFCEVRRLPRLSRFGRGPPPGAALAGRPGEGA
jgi:hypothetical protein